MLQEHLDFQHIAYYKFSNKSVAPIKLINFIALPFLLDGKVLTMYTIRHSQDLMKLSCLLLPPSQHLSHGGSSRKYSAKRGSAGAQVILRIPGSERQEPSA